VVKKRNKSQKSRAVITIKTEVDLEESYNLLFEKGFNPILGSGKNMYADITCDTSEKTRLHLSATIIQISFPWDEEKVLYEALFKIHESVKCTPSIFESEWKNITYPQAYVQYLQSIIVKKAREMIEEKTRQVIAPQRKTPLEKDIEKATQFIESRTNIKHEFKKRAEKSEKGS
jgi:hypothetical protein